MTSDERRMDDPGHSSGGRRGVVRSATRAFTALSQARPRQLAARAIRPINRRRTRAGRGAAAVRPLRESVPFWLSPAFASCDEVARGLPGSIDVLNERLPYPPPTWNPAVDRLRRFHLHYGEEILGAVRLGLLDTARAGLRAWIDANPPGSRDAWHPYPLSTRVGNWLAAIAIAPELVDEPVRESLSRQVAYLARNVENEVLGNHVIRNVRALALAGAAFDDGALLRRAERILDRELREQILDDGGHYERSPVYHLLVLRDLLEIERATPLGRTSSALARSVEQMKSFAAHLTRPDRAPALFNDGTLDLAPDLLDVLPAVADGLSVFPTTGYAVIRDGPLWLAFDCGPVSPPFLPAHAHADALSFQLWWEGAPIVADPGMPTYEAGGERDWFRGTRAHSTVSVDDGDQFELWGAFRAIRLPRVQLLCAHREARGCRLTAALAGFPAIAGGVEHERQIEWDGRKLLIRDRISGHGVRTVTTSLPLASGLVAPARLPQEVASVGVSLSGAAYHVERHQRAERLYLREPAETLVGSVRSALPIEVGWELVPGVSKET